MEAETFIQHLRTSLEEESFVKLTLSKPSQKGGALRNVFARLIQLKEESVLSFTLRYNTRDEVKNHPIEEAITLIQLWLGDEFLNADLFTTLQDYTLQYNRKRKARLFSKLPSHAQAPSTEHDKQKQRLIEPKGAAYLHRMGITGKDGQILKTGQRKFRQINKYIEVIDQLIKQGELGAKPHLVDMGSGKGYLTFALYDHLVNNLKIEASITGIELRPKLVEFCNQLAEDIGFDRLKFLAMDIEEYQPEKIDMLIALHACDIATDIAIAKGIKAQASFIVVAPCCHKQIRKQMQCQTALQSVLRHGILEERQAELVTDGIRSLLLEANGYKTKVFEFISTEHTPKNVMITATKGIGKEDALAQIDQIKKDFGIEYHYLERLL